MRERKKDKKRGTKRQTKKIRKNMTEKWNKKRDIPKVKSSNSRICLGKSKTWHFHDVKMWLHD